jgi:hypothetical protein
MGKSRTRTRATLAAAEESSTRFTKGRPQVENLLRAKPGTELRDLGSDIPSARHERGGKRPSERQQKPDLTGLSPTESTPGWLHRRMQKRNRGQEKHGGKQSGWTKISNLSHI